MGKPKKNKLDDHKPEVLGKKVKFIGLFGARFECFFCKRHIKSGMVSEYKNQLYCNEDCIKMSLKTNEAV